MKALKLMFSITTYILFLLVFNYLVVFIGGSFLKDWLPFLDAFKTIDSGTAYFSLPELPSWASNVFLLILFSFHHSLMARTGMKKLITKLVPESSERSTFVLVTCGILTWLFIGWEPQTTTVWFVEGALATGLAIFFLCGSGLVLWSTFMISHWQLFGLAQAWQAYKGQEEVKTAFTTPALYKYSRHPMYVGILIVMWSTPLMTSGHLMLAMVWTLYVMIGIYFEEKDLIRQFGQTYKDYQQQVSRLIPLKWLKQGKLPEQVRQP